MGGWVLLKVLVAVERAVVRGLLARVLVFRAWGMLSNILATWTRLATYMHSACEVATVTGYVPCRGYDHMYVPCLSEASCLLRLRVTNLSLRLRLLTHQAYPSRGLPRLSAGLPFGMRGIWVSFSPGFCSAILVSLNPRARVPQAGALTRDSAKPHLRARKPSWCTLRP
jgi:Flp pilus assembly pilin Flp